MEEGMKKDVILAGISICLTLAVTLIYELWFLSALPFNLIVFVCLRSILKSRKLARLEERKYVDMTAYAEQLLCSYKRQGQLLPSLEDCGTIFHKETLVSQYISEAIHVLKTGEGVESAEIQEEACSKMEKIFPSRRLRILHHFLCEVERTGGDREASVEILLEDLQMWKRRTVLHQKKRTFLRVEMMVASVLAAFMCYMSQLLTPSELGLHLPSTVLYQVMTSFILCSLFVILALVWKKMTGSWLDLFPEESKEQFDREEKQFRIIKGEEKANRLQRHVARRICKRIVEREYPYWLLSVGLKMQVESVYQAMKKSAEGKRGVFVLELKRLLQGIYEKPASVQPYTDFFRELQMPQVQTGMKILYSVQQNGYEDSKRQLDFLISQNNELMDCAEKNRFENQTAGLGLLKHLPMLAACVKLMTDLINLLIMTMSGFQTLV